MKKALFVFGYISLLLSVPYAADFSLAPCALAAASHTSVAEIAQALKAQEAVLKEAQEHNDRIFEALTGKKASPDATLADLEAELAALEEKPDDREETHGITSTTDDEELAALERTIEEEMQAEAAARKARTEARRQATIINTPATPATQTWSEWLWSLVQ